MIKRPKNTDTEDDILQMQKDFLAEKSKNANFEPAAKLVKIEPAKKISKFAQERAKASAKKEKAEESEKTEETKKKFKVTNVIIGNIVERTEDGISESAIDSETRFNESEGFPKPTRIDKKIKLDSSANQSIFAQTIQNSIPLKASPSAPIQNENKFDFGCRSNIIENGEAEKIHRENVEMLQRMSAEQILEERNRLLGTVDPALVQFLKEKRKSKLAKITETAPKDVEMKDVDPKIDSLPDIDVLKEENSKNWLHFDVIEPSKLEWMRDLSNNMPKLKPGEQYEARFDWKGVLLPFTMKDDVNTATASTDLYFHGDDAHRPGYTLQELFRLARSTVGQQRIPALGAVGGILNIYNQGYYDGIFELPISKIFFLLRYAFDDNTPTMVEVSAKALSTLFYNETDEVLLDMIYDCSFDCMEPTLEIRSDDATKKKSIDLDEQFKQMSIQSNVMQTNIADEEEDKLTSMNDFHLAETDLIQCLLRTNILQRIKYIFRTLNPKDSTKLSCVKILIRLARTSEDVAWQIISHSNLIQALMDQFTSTVDIEDKKQKGWMNSARVFTLKLFRILCAYGVKMINKLRDFGLKTVLKTCIFVQENSITVESVKNLIEALRCVRTIIVFSKSNDLLDEFLQALQYILEWIYQFVVFQDENHFLFRQCAAALIALLSMSNSTYCSYEKLNLCFSKWFTMAARHGNLELSQVVLLATCLNAIQIPDMYRDFLQNHLMKFLQSPTYEAMCASLSKSSGILSTYTFRQQDHTPLPHLNSIVFDSRNFPVFIVSDRPTIHFISSIVRFYNSTKCSDNGKWLNGGIRQYIESFVGNTKPKLSLNWFLRQEITFILDILKSSFVLSTIDKGLQLQLAYKVVECLTENQVNDLLHTFSQFIFNIELYPNKMDLTTDTMDQLKSSYGKICVEHYLNTIDARNSRENFDRIPMLAKDWPGMLLLKMYKAPETFQVLGLPEKDMILTTITFMKLQNVNDIKILTKTEQFIYTMIAFLGKTNVFLESNVKDAITEFVNATFTSQEHLDFDADFGGKFNFENLYISFLDQFQGVSYGDHTFSQLVLVPLAQKHNIKWRQMIWSEHLHVLRFITCSETELIGNFGDYVEPPETDVVLVESYYDAINSSILLPDKAPYKIAEHHFKAHKAKMEKTRIDKARMHKSKMDTS